MAADPPAAFLTDGLPMPGSAKAKALSSHPPARRVWIRGGHLVTAEGVSRADVWVEDGRIAQVTPRTDDGARPTEPVPEGVAVIEAHGRHLLPGVLDMHVHYRDPLPQNAAEDLRSGSIAAAAGGVVGFAEMPNTDPVCTTPQRLQQKLDLAAAKAVVDYSFFPAVSAEAGERASLRALDPTTIPGLKLFLGGTTRASSLDDAACADGFAIAAALGVPAVVHAEDDARIAMLRERHAGDLDDPAVHARIRDAEACRLCFERAVALASKAGAHLHVAHLTTAVEAARVRELKAAGVAITTEVTLHHLCFATPDYARLGWRLKCNPAVKDPADRDALWAALRDGTIDIVATDHAPHPLEQKAAGVAYDEAPSGVPGTESILPVLLDRVHRGDLALTDVARLTAARPAELYRVRGKGRIATGYDADVVICDLTRSRTVEPGTALTGAAYSAWEGQTLTGWPLLTLLRGRPVYAIATDPPDAVATPARPLRFR